jgi:PPE-repeat protein
MWIQAAATMSAYQVVSGTAVASAPQTAAAPQIQHADADDEGDGGIVDNDAGNPDDPSWWVNRFLEVPQTLWRDVLEFPQNPAGAITQLESDIPGLIADETGHAAEAYQAFAPAIQALALAVPAVSLGGLGGLAGLSGLAGIQPGQAPVPATPIPQPPIAVTHSPPAVSASAPVSAPAPTPQAPVSTPTAAPAPAAAAGAAPPPPPTGVGGAAYPYLVGGPTAGANTALSARAQRKAPEPDIAATAAVAAVVGESARQKQRARRRRRAVRNEHHRGYRFEFIDLDANGIGADPCPDSRRLATVAAGSRQSAAPMGFAGITPQKAGVLAAGLTTLNADEFGDGPVVPMVPGTWAP